MANVFIEDLSHNYKIEELPYNTFFLWNNELFMKVYSPDYIDNKDYYAVWNFNKDKEGELDKDTEVLWISDEDVEIRVVKRG